MSLPNLDRHVVLSSAPSPMMVFAAFRTLGPVEQSRVESRRRLFRSFSSATSVNNLSKSTSLNESTLFLPTSNVSCQSPERLPDLAELNESLLALAAIFPDVKPEVFREMLSTFSGDSRLHIVAEQLIKHKTQWVNGRWCVPRKDDDYSMWRPTSLAERTIERVEGGRSILVPLAERFRSESYKQAAKAALYQEFKSLSRSTVNGVLAEHNYSYTASRPVLLGLAAKSWRGSLNAFLVRWRKPSQEVSDKHYMIIWNKTWEGGPNPVPTLRETGDKELDMEIYTTVLEPLQERHRSAQEAINVELASLLNEQEAEEAHALYECECCFSETTFERMAICTAGAHTICFDCIQHAVSEALYGQSWGLNIDHTRGQIACLAPTTSGSCDGCIPLYLARRAVLVSPKGGVKMWQKLESRLSKDALVKSQIPLIRCPFCDYAEIDDLCFSTPPQYRLNTSQPLRTFLVLVITINFLPLLCLYTVLSHIFRLPTLTVLLSASLQTLVRATHLSPRFMCRSPSCLRASCLECHKAWRDPHVCHESATLSLRTTVEAAKTEALKRTCPRCNLGFVKDSGCNKMVCVCGYTMCYICRQGLGRKSSISLLPVQRGGALDVLRRAGVHMDDGGVDDGAGEGYQHFCQHFRPAGGNCRECEKCDLYRAEDEDEIVRQAGHRAEQVWREKEGLGKEIVTIEGSGKRHWRWGLQEGVDWWIDIMIKC